MAYFFVVPEVLSKVRKTKFKRITGQFIKAYYNLYAMLCYAISHSVDSDTGQMVTITLVRAAKFMSVQRSRIFFFKFLHKLFKKKYKKEFKVLIKLKCQIKGETFGKKSIKIMQNIYFFFFAVVAYF